MAIKGYPTKTHLSPNFKKVEFNCACGCAMPYDVELRLADLCEHLEKLRAAVGQPLRINSGYRCPAHNKRVGGAPKSQHCLGIAADVSCLKVTAQLVYLAAESIPAFHAGGIGLYEAWVHVDIRKDGPARWKG